VQSRDVAIDLVFLDEPIPGLGDAPADGSGDPAAHDEG
jgi:hypothetical protein